MLAFFIEKIIFFHSNDIIKNKIENSKKPFVQWEKYAIEPIEFLLISACIYY